MVSKLLKEGWYAITFRNHLPNRVTSDKDICNKVICLSRLMVDTKSNKLWL
jgi:hypothetical protein